MGVRLVMPTNSVIPVAMQTGIHSRQAKCHRRPSGNCEANTERRYLSAGTMFVANGNRSRLTGVAGMTMVRSSNPKNRHSCAWHRNPYLKMCNTFCIIDGKENPQEWTSAFATTARCLSWTRTEVTNGERRRNQPILRQRETERKLSPSVAQKE